MYGDFADIKKRHSIEDILAMLGVKTKPVGEALRGMCPVCEKERSLAVTPAKGLWKCFGPCNKGGDLINLVAHVERCSLREAALKIEAHFQLGGPDIPDALEALPHLQCDHDAVTASFTAADAKALGIGFTNKGVMRGFVAIPLRLPDGRLVGYVGVEPGAKLKLPKKLRISEN